MSCKQPHYCVCRGEWPCVFDKPINHTTMTRKEEIRDPGFYWVKTLNGAWMVAELRGRAFCLNGCSFPESDFQEIGQLLTEPESTTALESREYKKEIYRLAIELKGGKIGFEKFLQELSKFHLTRR